MARGQPVTQSSTFVDMIANRSVDGNYDTNGFDGSCSATSDDPGGPYWFMVDLGSISTIKYVVATNRGDGWSEKRIYSFIFSQYLMITKFTIWSVRSFFCQVATRIYKIQLNTRNEIKISIRVRYSLSGRSELSQIE